MAHTARNGYSTTQIALHWLTVVAVLTAFFSHDAMKEAARVLRESGGSPYPTVHTIAGATVLIVAIIRLIIRRRRGTPEPQGEGLQKLGAVWGHRLLYLMMFAVPIGGVTVWFGGVHSLGEVHGFAGQTLMVLFLGHAAMGLWHQYRLKDGTLTRMLRPEPK